MLEQSRKTYSIGVVGIGNVGWHYALIAMRYFPTRELCLVHKRAITPDLTAKKQVVLRRFFKVSELPKNLDIIFVCVQDSELEATLQEVANHVGENTLIVHCAGSVPLEAIPHTRRGVVYPLQSFKKGEFVKYNQIPFFIEGSDEESTETLENLFLRVSRKVYPQSSENRLRIHLSAVLAHNFSNFLWVIAQDILEKYQIPFRVLYPLLRSAIRNLEEKFPKQLQTGPAVRGDKNVIEKHLNALKEDFPEAENIYREFSDLIHKYFNENKDS